MGDQDYKKHAWTTAPTSSEASAADVPPVQPGPGWAPLGAWEVVSGTGDAESWHYALDFYHDAKYWSDSSWVSLCGDAFGPAPLWQPPDLVSTSALHIGVLQPVFWASIPRVYSSFYMCQIQNFPVHGLIDCSAPCIKLVFH